MNNCICEWQDGCGGTGVLKCEGCGGDQCCCNCGGEVECPGCDDCEAGFCEDDDYNPDAEYDRKERQREIEERESRLGGLP
jgi:hypothetical protein